MSYQDLMPELEYQEHQTWRLHEDLGGMIAEAWPWTWQQSYDYYYH